MSLMAEYIARNMNFQEMEDELRSLIRRYNNERKTFLFLYASANGKPVPDSSITMDDYYVIYDMLRNCPSKNLDFYIETPGGSGEAAEEIVRFLRSKFENVSFVITGEAKSAGTIIALSGDEILMTKSGSLGPIDAQLYIGRSRMSAYDYLEWVNEKRDYADKHGRLNPFDATMVAQITPGELNGVVHSLRFAEDLVMEWLPKYKFKNWKVSSTRKLPVTDEMKIARAQEIASGLTNHARWRSHGRSIKIDDLENIGLIITKIDANPKLADIVYRIHTLQRLIFNTSSTYKVYATENEKIIKHAAPNNSTQNIPPKDANIIEIEVPCPKCKGKQMIFLKFVNDPHIDLKQKQKGVMPYPSNNLVSCKNCKSNIDVSQIKNDIEKRLGKTAVL